MEGRKKDIYLRTIWHKTTRARFCGGNSYTTTVSYVPVNASYPQQYGTINQQPYPPNQYVPNQYVPNQPNVPNQPYDPNRK
jgi:hypothetical protein